MNPIFPITVTSGLTDKAGYFLKASGTEFAVCDSASDLPVGCLDHYLSDTKGGLALHGGACPVKVTGAVAQFGFGVLTATGTASAYSGTGVRVCQFLQAGVDGETVNAVILV